jgi:lipid II:glycine glycyltransferase (peptidoglycan interpeptide bridge formation enzyme)
MRQWDNYVRSHPDATPFHLHNWIKTIYESYGFEPFLYTVRDSLGSITSVLPLFRIKSIVTGSRLVSLPFTDYCGPLCNSREEEKTLLDWVIETFSHTVRHIEIRSGVMNTDYFKRDEFYKRHVLELTNDASEILGKCDKKTIQYSIRKAQKSGVLIREENSQQGMDEFYGLNKMTRKKHGIPHQSPRFFANLFKNMFSDNSAFLLLAFSESRVIAGGLFFRLNNTLYYKYNASDQEYLTEKKPNHLLAWHAIEKACQEHLTFLDFGRTSPCNEGLMRYKEMWGAKAHDLPYNYFPEVKGLSCGKTIGSSCMEKLTRIWQKLPDPIVDAVSFRILKHLA